MNNVLQALENNLRSDCRKMQMSKAEGSVQIGGSLVTITVTPRIRDMGYTATYYVNGKRASYAAAHEVTP